MKLTLAFARILAVVATATFTNLAIDNSVKAASTFEEQQIDQNQVIAIARPYGDRKYDLLVIEQIPGQQQCWSESGSNPTLVEPLLLNFDFTGSCNRSTDSNGYSIRIEGQDYGLNYLLRIVERNGELFLIGTHRTNLSQPEIIVGRTYGMKAGFLKIVLNPGWQFSKRAYQGKILGHVYFSGDRTALNAPSNSTTTVAARPPRENGESSLSDSPPTMSDRTNTSLAEPSDPQSNSTVKEITFTAQNPTPSSSSSPRSPSSLPLPPSLSASRPSSSLLTSEQDARTTSSSPSSGRLPLPPTIPSGQTQNTPPPPSSTNSISSFPPLPPPPQASNSQVVPRPTISPKSNSERTLSDMISVAPRSLPGSSNQASASAPDVPTGTQSYRVLIATSDTNQQKQVRSLYPDAFRTVYQGRAMWQVGVFSSWDNADQALQSLKNRGLDGLILE